MNVDLTILANRAQANAPHLDVRVLWVPVDEGRTSTTQWLLFREQVFPVCHPAVLDEGRPLVDAASLASLPLLHKGPEGPRGHAVEWDWDTWFARLGIQGRPRPALRFDDIGTAISAALEGAGVVLARSLLVHDALQDGRLARPLDASWDMPSSKAHVASWPAALSGDQRVRTFVDWLAAAAERTVTEPNSDAVTPGLPLHASAGGG